MNIFMRKPVFRIFDKVQQKLGTEARGLLFRIQKEEELYYLYVESNGSDLLAADLCLCFCICEKQVF